MIMTAQMAAYLPERLAEQQRFVDDLERLYAALREDDSTQAVTDWCEEWPAQMPWWQRRQVATDECVEALRAAHTELKALKEQAGETTATVRPGMGE